MLLPTRGRSRGLLKAHFDSVMAMTEDFTRICYTVLIDEDDEQTREFFGLADVPYYFRPVFTFRDCISCNAIQNSEFEQPHLARFYNTLYENSCWREEPGTLVSMVGDDMEWRTRGYEHKILDACNARQGIAVVCCNDGFHHSRKRFVNMFTTRKLVNAMGATFMCPDFPADYIDDIWWMIADRIGAAVFLDDVMLYHDHASRRPQTDHDETCRRLRRVVSDSRRNLALIDPWVAKCVSNINASGVLCAK
jgi:hypothetical protein